jgi:hypothetical protein
LLYLPPLIAILPLKIERSSLLMTRIVSWPFFFVSVAA